MANHKSAEKRARQNEIRRLRNKSVKTRVKSVVKGIRAAVAEKRTDVADQLQQAQSVIDKAAKKGVLHHRTAARKIARLTRSVNNTPSA